jgi:hypothetical protein
MRKNIIVLLKNAAEVVAKNMEQKSFDPKILLILLVRPRPRPTILPGGGSYLR